MSRAFTGKLRERILERDNYMCVNCEEIDNLQIDHIKDYASGGETSYENGQVLCMNCNQEKNRYRNLYFRWLSLDKYENDIFKYEFLYKPLSKKILEQIEIT